MFQWRNYTNDPNNSEARIQFDLFLKSIRAHTHDLTELVAEYCKGKRVLDVGMADHNVESTEQLGWRHDLFKQSASYILGVDILEDVVDHLKGKGYNVVCADATSDVDLGDRFDLVVLGEIIEHVNDPVKLIEFAKRHLTPNGEILVTTPSPFYIGRNIKLLSPKSIYKENFEHIMWITPTNMNEICCRTKMIFSKYYICTKGKGETKLRRMIINLLSHTLSPEVVTHAYAYILKRE